MEIRSTSHIDTSFIAAKVQTAENDVSSNITSQEGNDEINMSREALLITEALRTAQNAPDLRADKVAELRSQIQNGTYQINPNRIAGALLTDEWNLLNM